MKVGGPGPIRPGALRGASAGAAGGTGFTLDIGGPERGGSVAGSAAVSPLSSVLALQSVGDATTGRSKGLKRGRQLLDLLDDIRDGLLAGGIDRGTLTAITRLIADQRGSAGDPQLDGLLDEIDLRAQVELAKLERV